MIEAISHLIHRDYEAIVQDFITLRFIPKGETPSPPCPCMCEAPVLSLSACVCCLACFLLSGIQWPV